MYIDGATEIVVNSDLELLKILETGSHKRHVSGTSMNVESSRSHAICMISLAAKNTSDLTVKTGKLFLVDLAGSEMVRKTGATDQRLQEAKQINKSLTSLGIVIKTLTERKLNAHVPYRDSKLTRILQDSLGGTSRASLIACSPSSFNVAETIATWGTVARGGRAPAEGTDLQAEADRGPDGCRGHRHKENQTYKSLYGELRRRPRTTRKAAGPASAPEGPGARSWRRRSSRSATRPSWFDIEVRAHIVSQRTGEARYTLSRAAGAGGRGAPGRGGGGRDSRSEWRSGGLKNLRRSRGRPSRSRPPRPRPRASAGTTRPLPASGESCKRCNLEAIPISPIPARIARTRRASNFCRD